MRSEVVVWKVNGARAVCQGCTCLCWRWSLGGGKGREWGDEGMSALLGEVREGLGGLRWRSVQGWGR